ncbi:MAG: EI24 domain-containing protein [Betaproteobacteria bacterium]
MANILLALMRSFTSLARPRVWTYILAPAALSLLIWLALAIWGMGTLVGWLEAQPPMTWLIGWGAVWLAHLLAWIGGWMAVFAVTYLTASLLAATLVMPWLLEHIAARDYPDVARMGADSFVAAATNSVVATVLFIFGWLLTLPLWLIPGGALIVPLLLMAWLNRRTFAYDALSLHATPGEWRTLRRGRRKDLFLLGLIMAILAHVPLIGLLVPAFTALAYVHYSLEALRRARGGALITGEARRIEDNEGELP